MSSFSSVSSINSRPIPASAPNQLAISDELTLNLEDIPIRALNISCRTKLSRLLNSEAATDKDGYNRDYRGLAELLGFEHDHIVSFMRESDPTGKILSNWEYEPGSTIGALFSHLEYLERMDVVDQIRPIAERNAQQYVARLQDNQIVPVQVGQVDYEAVRQEQIPDDPNCLTSGDAKGYGPEKFDAYVCYADEDLEFVEYMTGKLEARGIKVCLKDRDVLPARFEYDSIVRLIEERCSRMLIVWSPEFSQSAECDFLTKFATGLTVEYQRHKIIPVIYKPCPLSRGIKFLSKVDFTRPNVRNWSWDRLITSLKQGNSSYFASHFASSGNVLQPPPYQTEANPLPIDNHNGNTNQQLSTNGFNDTYCGAEPIIRFPTPSLDSTQTSSESSMINNSINIADVPSPPSDSLSQSPSTSSITSNKIHKAVRRVVRKLTSVGHSKKQQSS